LIFVLLLHHHCLYYIVLSDVGSSPSIIATVFSTTDGQTCLTNPNINQRENAINNGRQVIVPNTTFNCNGRITSIGASMRGSGRFLDPGSNLPMIQAWRPSPPGSDIYIRVNQVQTSTGMFIRTGTLQGYYVTNISLTGSNRIEFQSGDVIGYYQPNDPQRRISSTETSGYTSYSNSANSPATIIDISDVDNVEPDRQPLIEILFGKKAYILFCYLKLSSVLLWQYLVFELGIYIRVIANLHYQPQSSFIIRIGC